MTIYRDKDLSLYIPSNQLSLIQASRSSNRFNLRTNPLCCLSGLFPNNKRLLRDDDDDGGRFLFWMFQVASQSRPSSPIKAPYEITTAIVHPARHVTDVFDASSGSIARIRRRSDARGFIRLLFYINIAPGGWIDEKRSRPASSQGRGAGEEGDAKRIAEIPLSDLECFRS